MNTRKRDGIQKTLYLNSLTILALTVLFRDIIPVWPSRTEHHRNEYLA